ncbi:response regulator transcription factor [Methylomonas sp. AM2-LC]|uniref:response regulator transcription factor n=1 Tax=Methylomonas sp. AM2-LC TaxID=3153301 RepID=UPI0032676F04
MIKVMLVDDHAMFRNGLKLILNEVSDMEIAFEAADGDEAISGIRTNLWDILILDISMPGKNVLDLIKMAKEYHPNKPILVLSAYPEDQYAIRILRAGAQGYLSKECAAEKLVDAIQKLANGGKYVSSALGELLANELTSSTRLPHQSLTDREYLVFLAIAKGNRLVDIGIEYSLSQKTISTYRARILKKMQLSTNAEVIHYAIKHNLLNTRLL